MTNYNRTHLCDELRDRDKGKRVVLAGWVDRYRDHGGLIFIDLRDRHGLTQLVFDPEINVDVHATGEKLRAEWVIAVKGTVRERLEGMDNSKIATGAVEVVVDEIEILSKAKTPPFSICDDLIDVNEELRLKYRYLDIRRGDIAKKLALRHRATMTARRYLDEQGFLEIATPILGKSTPEGARDYLVPSRLSTGSFYALPQSPQLFKQLLMIAGMDRYFQIAQCFRDEDLRADRQPEFTQIDMEMSFGIPEQLMGIVEGMLQAIFRECLDTDISTPFRQLSHKTCVERYGCDRPDLRFGMELASLDDIARASSFTVFLDQLKEGGIVKGLCVKGGADLTRKAIEDYTAFVGRFGVQGLAWMKMHEGELVSNIAKFFGAAQLGELALRLHAEEGDLIFMVADMPARANQALDHLRRRIAKERHLIDASRYEFVWVTDFPLFCWNADEQRLDSEHHPFTSPHPDDIARIDTDPLSVRSLGYDIVLNGYEIGGGSQRIHDSGLQQKIFEKLRLTPEELKSKFGFFLEALSYGTPPHLGIALGLDRIIMALTGTDNIRDVIAFPKTQKAGDLMMECPSKVTKRQLDELRLVVVDPDFHGHN